MARKQTFLWEGGSGKNPFVSQRIHGTGIYIYMGVSKNNGTPKSSIVIGFSIINHLFWGTPIFENIHIFTYIYNKHQPMKGNMQSSHGVSIAIVHRRSQGPSCHTLGPTFERSEFHARCSYWWFYQRRWDCCTMEAGVFQRINKGPETMETWPDLFQEYHAPETGWDADGPAAFSENIPSGGLNTRTDITGSLGLGDDTSTRACRIKKLPWHSFFMNDYM